MFFLLYICMYCTCMPLVELLIMSSALPIFNGDRDVVAYGVYPEFEIEVM
jgi:hypothetical protein